MHNLYIGLHGLAGSGKDTVGKMLKHILNNYGDDCEVLWQSYQDKSLREQSDHGLVHTEAFADKLKIICSQIFGVPLETFYTGNKAHAWVCINKDFEYTEELGEGIAVTAEDFYNGEYPDGPVWMSIREMMVYVGTYLLQQYVNPYTFINISENNIRRSCQVHPEIKYLLLTDCRFEHEIDYIKGKRGILLDVVRNSVKRLDNIAENSIGEEQEYDYTIINNGSYEELFRQVYNLVHSELVFENKVIELEPRTITSNKSALRLECKTDSKNIYLLIYNKLQHIKREDGNIISIDPVGGPMIEIDVPIAGTDIVPSKIWMNSETLEIWIEENLK